MYYQPLFIFDWYMRLFTGLFSHAAIITQTLLLFNILNNVSGHP